VRGQGPEQLEYKGAAKPLQLAWVALRTNIRDVMDKVTLEDIVADELPASVRELSEPAEAWSPR
jgi:DNA-binding IscR family transcriptional regulator